MSNSSNQKNSFVSIAEQVAILNKNSVEIISKLNDVVSSQSSAVQINYTDESGTITQYSLPTVSYLKTLVDQANTNIKRMATFNDKTTYMIDGESTKKVYQMDLNREPDQINYIDQITTFTPVNNWFFDAFVDPLLTVDIDLSSKIDDDVNKILSRRYVVSFTRDSNSAYTNAGLSALNDFKSKFLNRNDIDITEFLNWFNNPSNTGIYGNNNPNVQTYDEQIFNIDYNTLDSYGVFSVLKQELDSLNSKLWYHINTLSYYDVNVL